MNTNELNNKLQSIENTYYKLMYDEINVVCKENALKEARFKINDIVKSIHNEYEICINVIDYDFFNGIFEIVYRGNNVMRDENGKYIKTTELKGSFRDSICKFVESVCIDYDIEFNKLTDEYQDKVNELNKKYAIQQAKYKVGDILKLYNIIIKVDEILPLEDNGEFIGKFDRVGYQGIRIKKSEGKYHLTEGNACICDEYKAKITKLNIKINE